jgi:CheY-like chemotaxis protein
LGPISDLHKEYLGDVLTSSRHLLQLINDILDLAKVEAGKIEFRPEEVDIAQLVDEDRDILRTLAAAKLLHIAVEVDPALTTVVADPSRLKQILYNYLSNAIKFTPDHGRVTIRVAPEDVDDFRLEVEDTGIGIRPQDMERLFVEFQQLDAGASKKYQGTGLGLALTKRIAEAQGGRVGVRSTPGEGSVFFAVLPRVAAPARTAAGLGDRLQGSRATARRRILVVEDDHRNREWLVQILADAGYAVTAAESGAEALTLCRRQDFYGAVRIPEPSARHHPPAVAPPCWSGRVRS